MKGLSAQDRPFY